MEKLVGFHLSPTYILPTMYDSGGCGVLYLGYQNYLRHIAYCKFTEFSFTFVFQSPLAKVMMSALKCPHRGEFTEEIRDSGEFCKYRHVCQTNSKSLPLKQTNMMSEKKSLH